jgi:hypothetical protein
MLVSSTNGVFGTPTTIVRQNLSYADIKNARFNNDTSQIFDAKARWIDTCQSSPSINQAVIANSLTAAVNEFRLRNPHITSWNDIERRLARACSVPMPFVKIDATMQRLLNVEWVLDLFNKFTPTKVLPIQVYQPDPTVDEYLAWDGQHTLILLWLIATQVFGEDPENVNIPVNIYDSHYKAEMRSGFVSLNSSDGSRQLDLFDLYEQMVYGVRIDKSTNPDWLQAERKQSIVESHGLFLTSKKFGDHDQPGAISRMQEVNKLTTESLTWLCEYLVAVGAQNRPVEEKEMVMMAYFFDKCRFLKTKIDTVFIYEIAAVAKRCWKADFGPYSDFWVKVQRAYGNWHLSVNGPYAKSHFNKEPIHGYPFMVEQFKKDLPHQTFPDSRTNSDFKPAQEDLF